MFKAISKAKAASLLVNAVYSAILLGWSYISINKFVKEPIATEITFVKKQQGLSPPIITVCKIVKPLKKFLEQNITDEDINSKKI